MQNRPEDLPTTAPPANAWAPFFDQPSVPGGDGGASGAAVAAIDARQFETSKQQFNFDFIYT